MIFRLFLILIISFSFYSCSKNNELVYQASKKVDPYILYKEALEAFEQNDYFFASKKLSEAELNFEKVELAAKSAIMSSFSLYELIFIVKL